MRLARSMSHPARFDGSQCHNYIFRHCKRLVLRLILACSIKSTLIRLKCLKTSNTRLYSVYIIKSYTGFVYLSMYDSARTYSRTTCDSSTAQQLNSFLRIKIRAFTRLFFARLIKAVLYHFFIFWRGLYSLFSSSRRSNIHHIPNSGI